MIRIGILLVLMLSGCAEVREAMHLGQPLGHIEGGRK
jgi:hypothetical protein